MCAAALLYRSVRKVFYGCGNPRFGGNGSVLALHAAVAQPAAPVGGAAAPGGGAPLLAGYASEGGHRGAEAVALLQTFYGQENDAAPPNKRRCKEGRGAAAEADADAGGDHDADTTR
jgi:tRNA-specific adenosine deaminase 2